MLDWLACALVRGTGWCLCHLPVWLCVRLGEGLGVVGSWLQPKRARIGYLNVKAAFGERVKPAQAKRMVRQVFRNLGMGLVEMLRLPVIDGAYVDRYIEVVGYPHFETAVASGRPVVVLTGHFGNWELCPIAAALKGYPVTALARAQARFPRLYRLLVSYRESKGCRIVHKGGAMRQLLQALDRREVVGIVGDQASRQGIFIEFFGRPALFATGPFELARASKALIVTTFIHRLQGPFHRLVVEPPIELPQHGEPETIVRAGIEQFVQVLAKHIEADPAQWLWLHNRWKHTPVRRVLVLSDGKLGHLKQSLAVVQALKEASSIREQVVEVRYRHRLGRLLAVLWAWLVPRGWGGLACLRLALEPAAFRQLACASVDLVISCGASPAAVNVLLSAENRAKSVVIMNPTPIPLRRFTLAFVPVHDRLPKRANVVQLWGSLTSVNHGRFTEAREQLRTHPRFRPSAALTSCRARHSVRGRTVPSEPQRVEGLSPEALASERPVIAVFLGGETSEYQITTSFTESLMRQVLAVCEETSGSCLITTSRRTAPSVERWLSEHLANHPRCRLLLLASRDQLDGTIEGMLGWAQVVVVTGESISMVSEACASGRYVVVVEPPLRQPGRARLTKSQYYLRLLAEHGYIRSRPLPEVGHAIRRALSDRPPVRRLDTYTAVREAVARLL